MRDQHPTLLGEPVLGLIDVGVKGRYLHAIRRAPGDEAADCTDALSVLPGTNLTQVFDPIAQAARRFSEAPGDGANALLAWRDLRLQSQPQGEARGKFIMAGPGFADFFLEAPHWIRMHLIDAAYNGIQTPHDEIYPDGFVTIFDGVAQRILAYLEPGGRLSIVSIRFPARGYRDAHQFVLASTRASFDQCCVPIRAFPEFSGNTALDYTLIVHRGPQRAALRLREYIFSYLGPRLPDPLPDPAKLTPLVIPPIASADEGETDLRVEEEQRTAFAHGSAREMKAILRAAIEIVSAARAARGESPTVGCVFITGYDDVPYDFRFNGTGYRAMAALAAALEARFVPRAKLLSHATGNRASEIEWRGACMVVRNAAAGEYTAHDLLEAGALLDRWLQADAGMSASDAQALIAGLSDPVPYRDERS